MEEIKVSQEKQEVSKEQFSKEKFEKLIYLLDQANCGLFVLRANAEMEIMYANPYFYKMFQYTQEEFEKKFGNSIMAAVIPEETQKMKALMARQNMMGGNLRLEFRVRKKDGSVMFLALNAQKIWHEKEEVLYGTCIDITESKYHLEEAYRAKHELDLVANNIPGGLVKICMSDFKILYANDGFYRLSGHSKAEYNMTYGNCCDQIIYEPDRKLVYQMAEAAVSNRGLVGMEYRILHKNGSIRWSYMNGCRIDDVNGEPVYLCIIMDITSKKEYEAELQDNEERTRLLSTFLHETLWTYEINEKRLHRSGNLGQTYSELGLIEGDFVLERLEKIIHPRDIDLFVKMYRKMILQQGQMRNIFRICDDKGNYREVEVSAISVAEEGDGVPTKIYGVTRSIVRSAASYADKVESAATQDVGAIGNQLYSLAQMAQQTLSDRVTGLLSYSDFLTRAMKTLAAREKEEHYALVCADINQFQKFSYHYGLSISTGLLKIFADTVLNSLSKDGICTRVGGDYFVVLVQYDNHKALLKTMASILHHQENLEKEKDYIHYGSTWGVYLVQPEDVEIEKMLEKADLARRSIKGLVGNHYAIYTEEVQENRFKEEKMIQEICESMENHKAEVDYLPRIRNNKEDIVGCKAIIRIQLSDGQYLETEQINRYLERGNHMAKFNDYILREVCGTVGAWKAKGNKVLPVSIVLTASQLATPGMVGLIDRIVQQENGLEPGEIMFEVPERYFTDGMEMLELAVRELGEKGYPVIISHFGENQLAVHLLRRLPIAGIKFHGECFGKHMTEERDEIIFRDIVAMVKKLGMSVCCGGIHTQLQEDYAKKIGCELFEGDMYYGAVKNAVFEKCFF